MVEYPGYGVYKADKCDKRMQEDSLIVFDFVCNTLGFHPGNVFIFGRSIGTGPATYLARYRSTAKILILLSPFTNLRAVASDFVSILSIMFKDRFRNIDHINHMNCPVIIIHGKEDEIIKYEHAVKLIEKCNSFCRLITPPNMTHNNFRLFQDLIIPIKKFLNDIKKKYEDNPDNKIKTDSNKINLTNLKLYKSDYLYRLEKQIVRYSFGGDFASWRKSTEKIKKKNESEDFKQNNDIGNNLREINSNTNNHRLNGHSRFKNKIEVNYNSPLKNNFNKNSINPKFTKKPYYREKSPNVSYFHQITKNQ